MLDTLKQKIYNRKKNFLIATLKYVYKTEKQFCFFFPLSFLQNKKSTTKNSLIYKKFFKSSKKVGGLLNID